MYTISKEFHFSASHILDGLPNGHPCGRLHGHNYRIIIALQSDALNDVGFVRDFGELKAFKSFIDTTLDHRHLNDVLPMQPSAEHIARWLYEQAKPLYPELHSVTVWETEKCSAVYHE